jgi:ADP-heptose:LPS heptosyltransferase
LPQWRDIGEEAALMRGLDLMISIDSLPAHLAGALGVPVWMLLHKQADWRWMEERDDSPWYPTMRLFRQQRLGDWQPVIAAVASELAQVSAAAFR